MLRHGQEHPDIELPEESCDILFDKSIVVRTDFIEESDNVAGRYLSRSVEWDRDANF